MSDWSKPTLTSNYSDFVAEVKGRDDDLAKQFDGTTSPNVPTGTIRWNGSNRRHEKWNGSAWSELVAKETTAYAIRVEVANDADRFGGQLPSYYTDIPARLGYTPVNESSISAANLLATLSQVDGNGSGLDADMLDGKHASSFALFAHSHNSLYLGINAKAADSELLDGLNSTAFLRAVNGVGPDANGNVSVDLSSRVAKSGDIMSGRLTLPSQTVQSSAPTIDFQDTDQGTTRYLHVNNNLMGFLKTDSNWDMYTNNGGSMWTAGYGWLHDYFFNSVDNCVREGFGAGSAGNCSPGESNVINCYGTGNIMGYQRELVDNGGQVAVRSVRYYYNCNCNCDCTCY